MLVNLNLNPKPNFNKIIRGLIVAIILSVLILFFYSCGCNYHLDKAAKKCGSHLIKDTIRITDTLITKEIKHDTTFKYFQRDSIIVREGKLTMKYFYNQRDSTVYMQGKCASDTVIKVIKVGYDKIVLETNWWDKFKWFIYIGMFFVGLYLILRLLKK